MNDPSSHVARTSEIDEYLPKSALEAQGSDIEALRSALLDASSRFQKRLGSVSARSPTTQAAEGKWSPAEVADHLYRANLVFIRAVREARTDCPLKLPKGQVGPNGGLIAPRSTWPRTNAPLDHLIENLGSSCRTLIDEVRSLAEQGFERRHCFVSPFYGPLSAVECLQLAIVHILHHTNQLPS